MTLNSPLEFQDNVTSLDAATLNKIVDRGQVNILKNAAFDSWFGGTSVAPDGWVFDDGGATITRESSVVSIGKYSAKISKTTSDTDASKLYQNIYRAARGGFAGNWITAIFRIYALRKNVVRVFVDDGVAQYSDYITDTNQWVDVAVEIQLDSAITDLKVGVIGDYDAARNYDFYVDCGAVLFGRVSGDGSIFRGAQDESIGCLIYDNDGTTEQARGAIRAIPFKLTGTTGTNNYHTESYALPHGCKEIIAAFASVESIATANLYDVFVSAGNFDASAGTLDFYLRNVAGNFATESFTLRGVVFVAGWDDENEVHGE